MRGVKLLVVLSMRTLYLTTMSWRVGTNLFFSTSYDTGSELCYNKNRVYSILRSDTT